ncbi:MAG: diguanylate cyclase, partial [Nitrospira sp.]|nr:diguanylate cyclase [Nitrospira sp.]
GIISLAYLEEDHTFEDEEILLLSWFAELASIALDNVQLYNLAKQELAERKQVEEALRKSLEALRESEQRFRQMLENIQLAAVGVDAQGNITSCNNYLLNLTGWRREQVLGQNWFETFIPLEFREEMKRAFQKTIASRTSPARVEREIQTKRGERHLISWSSTLLQDSQGNVIGLTSVGEDITARRNAEEKIHHLAYYDVLTSLPNRILFRDRLVLELAHVHRSEKMLAVIFLDLDHFKVINDTLGHAMGDRLLQHVADRLTGCLREGDTVSRMGGDEFTLLLPQINHVEDAAAIARKILETFKPSFHFEGHELHITPSIGIALYPNDGEDAQT